MLSPGKLGQKALFFVWLETMVERKDKPYELESSVVLYILAYSQLQAEYMH